MINLHNYGRYYGNIITDTAGFKTYWTTVAKQFSSNSKVIFDTMNECKSISRCAPSRKSFE